jgi:4-hydroxybenzoate polyprenyltransferase
MARVLRPLGGLVRACHPEATAAVTAAVVVLSVAAGRAWASLWAGAAVLAGQLSVGWGNDWLDLERDRAAARSDKPLVAGRVSPAVVHGGWVLALAAAVGLSLASGLRAAAAHMLAVGLAWAYNLRLKASPLSPLPYAAAFALLPVFVAVGAHGGWPAPWVVVAAGCLGAGAHFTQTLPDLERDAATGVRGLPHRLGAGGSLAASAALLTGAGVALAVGPEAGPPPAAQGLLLLVAALVAATVLAGMRGARRSAFLLTLATAGALVAALLVAAPEALHAAAGAPPDAEAHRAGCARPV